MSEPHQADAAASVAPAEKLVGRPVRRVEDCRLLAGLGRYVDDRPLPNGLHVAILRSDQPHARIASVRMEAALAVPGVAGVFQWQDIEAFVRPAVATSRMADYQATAIHALAKGEVRYVGEPVVAVVAQSRYIAEDAVELVEVAYEPLPFANDPASAAEPGAPLLHAGFASNVLVQRAFTSGGAVSAVTTAEMVGRVAETTGHDAEISGRDRPKYAGATPESAREFIPVTWRRR